ncbi:MAG: GNAT family N-acetyltransferase [Pedobacter sp.]
MKKATITVRRMNRADVDLAIDWAALEGWNPGLHDAESFYCADPSGFFMAEVNGEAAGCISAVAYDESFGFMGFYIVRPELRHEGIGMALWHAAMEHMGERVIGGDGVVDMLNKYALSGFRIAHRNARYEGIGRASGSHLVALADVPFAELVSYDRRFFPAPRTAFLKSWINQPGSHGQAVMAGGRLHGYGVIRPCRRGFKIAPLFADTPDIAEELFGSLSSFAKDEPMFLDIPVCNQAAQQLVERHAMKMVFETARIYRGTPPVLPLEQIYGITSFELG